MPASLHSHQKLASHSTAVQYILRGLYAAPKKWRRQFYCFHSGVAEGSVRLIHDAVSYIQARLCAQHNRERCNKSNFHMRLKQAAKKRSKTGQSYLG